MIRELANDARRQGVHPGECLEVHVCGEDVNVIQRTTATEFVRTWSYVGAEGVPSDSAAYLGLVHEDGAVLVEL